jgi:hypothetical protein
LPDAWQCLGALYVRAFESEIHQAVAASVP